MSGRAAFASHIANNETPLGASQTNDVCAKQPSVADGSYGHSRVQNYWSLLLIGKPSKSEWIKCRKAVNIDSQKKFKVVQRTKVAFNRGM
jgi:hypothetical protein